MALARRCDWIRVPMNELPGTSLQPIDAGDAQRDRRLVVRAFSLPVFHLNDYCEVLRPVCCDVVELGRIAARHACGCAGQRGLDVRAASRKRPEWVAPGHIVTIGEQRYVAAAVPFQHRVERGVIPRDGVFESFRGHIVLLETGQIVTRADWDNPSGAVHRVAELVIDTPARRGLLPALASPFPSEESTRCGSFCGRNGANLIGRSVEKALSEIGIVDRS